MKNHLFTIALLLLLSQQALCQLLYVSGTGNDSNNGRSRSAAFRTLQKAEEVVKPGDVVLIGDGIYTDASRADGSAVLSITKSGKPDAWITWKADKGSHPEIRPEGWAGIQITASYHIIDGLTITGGNDSLVLVSAQEDAKKPKADPKYNTNGILINGRPKTPEEKPHHIVIRNCTVGKCPGGGLVAIQADYITMEDCKVYNNAWFMRYGGSGISTLDNWAYDDKPGYHMIIQRNYVWNNRTQVQWVAVGRLSDGNGIILDVTDQDEAQGATNINADAVVKPGDTKPSKESPAPVIKPKRPEWFGRSLVANNLSFYNGGSGIHTFRTRHVDIINNTTYSNGQVMGYPELFANRSQDVNIINNIIVPRPGGKVTSNGRNANNRWDFNIYPQAQSIITGPNDIVADAQFIHIDIDPAKCDFHLKKSSPARGSGSSDLAQKTDIAGKLRPTGNGIDRGAFQQ